MFKVLKYIDKKDILCITHWKKLSDKIWEQRGLATGLGYPTRQDIERLIVAKKAEEGPILADLKRKWAYDITSMAEIIGAAEVEEMLTPERCESFAFSRPMTADEAQHVEELYLSDEFGRDKDKVMAFLSEAKVRDLSLKCELS